MKYLIIPIFVLLLASLFANSYAQSTGTINRGGQDYEVIQVDLTKKVQDTDVISKTVLGVMENDKPVLLAVSDHDGYPIISGDTITSIWTIIRPAH